MVSENRAESKFQKELYKRAGEAKSQALKKVARDTRSNVAKKNWERVSPYFKGIMRGQEKHDKK